MRDIKFRAWDKVNKKWLNCGTSVIGTIFCWKNRKTIDTIQDRYELQQYTGLNDKNNREIYEGDIIQGFGRVFLIKFGIVERYVQSDYGDINLVQIPSFYFEHEGHALYPISENYKGRNDLEDLEVIGNVFEDRELLEVRT